MSADDLSREAKWRDVLAALAFAQSCFDRWQQQQVLRPEQAENCKRRLEVLQNNWQVGQQKGEPAPTKVGLPGPQPGERDAARLLRHWYFVQWLLRNVFEGKTLPLAKAHELLALARENQATLERGLTADELPILEVLPASAGEQPGAPEVPAAPPRRRRPLVEVLLDPRNLQWAMAFTGATLVFGIVLLLWVNNFFQPPETAVGLGLLNTALLLGGWWLVLKTRYQLAGRAITLLGCLIMPLNLWYYHVNDLITLDHHLWVAALVISGLYLISARVLRDELFVYVFMGGVTLTGLLLLAHLPPSPEKFWEIALPATLLVVLGLSAIHVERAFPEQEGPFSRQRFGMAFFWSGHALLGAGLLLVLGAQVAGRWLYDPLFKPLYERWQAGPSPITTDPGLRLLALVLVVAGTYAYLYSDLVVRRVGVYVYLAGVTLMWALILGVEQLNLALGVDALIAVLAVMALAVNLSQATVFRDSPFTRGFPFLGMLLPLLAVAMGLVVCLRHISPDLRSVWPASPPEWGYVGAMVLTAVSCRVGAHLYRSSHPRLTAGYFFATGAATLVAATAALAAWGLTRWEQHAPLLMLVPLAYLIAARLYRGSPVERPLLWVSHAATAVMLVSSLAAAVQGFTPQLVPLAVEQKPLNLVLALFCGEAMLFYILAAVFYRQTAAIHLAAAMACGAVWQLLTFAGVGPEVYTLAFAVVGLALLLAYRFAALEQVTTLPAVEAIFQVAGALLTLAFVAGFFLALSRLATQSRQELQWGLVGLNALLTLCSLTAVGLVRQMEWRRWYVVTTIAQGILTFIAASMLSQLTPWQKFEIASVVIGLLLLVLGHIGWSREQEQHNHLVGLCLLYGSLLFGVPPAIASWIDRSRDQFLVLNELGFFAAGALLLTSGLLFQLRSTTLTGGGLMSLYFLTLPLLVRWSELRERLGTVAVIIIVVSGVLFSALLLLSVYRERLLTLPDKIKRREGVFRVLSWR